MTAPQLLIATYNRGKLEELREILRELPFELFDLNSFQTIEPVPETGSTFPDNARLKATGYAKQSGLMTLADDSGLEVKALGGEPGVRSARYAGEYASDAERVSKLLQALSNKGGSERAARFVSAIAIASSEGALLNMSVGVCRGNIAAAPRGANGFGYDPIFIPEGHQETFAELSAETKNRISHRARALQGAIQFLSALTAPSRDS